LKDAGLQCREAARELRKLCLIEDDILIALDGFEEKNNAKKHDEVKYQVLCELFLDENFSIML